MFQGKRMVLKRGVKVRHGRIAGIARLGKETEVCQLQFPGDVRTGAKESPDRSQTDPRMKHEHYYKYDIDRCNENEQGGFAHGAVPLHVMFDRLVKKHFTTEVLEKCTIFRVSHCALSVYGGF
jgi:hypothetical protein